MQTADAIVYTRQIDRLEAINAALLDYRSVAVPGPRPKGTIELGAEIYPVPHIDNTIGAKVEPVSPPPVGGRLRADWSPVRGLRLGAYLIPPLTVRHITARLAGVEAEYGWRRNAWVGSIRVFDTQGSVTGPFTAPEVEDRFRVKAVGADLRLGWVTGVWTWYAGVGEGRNHTQFRLALDGAVIDGQRNYRYGFAGVGWARGAWSLVAEQHRTESYLNHVFLRVNYGF
ncbi:MAG: hypothetical protein OEW21_11435 [Betaproteobacteria bacterium]|nr:hypothetical protein [Betaproteobacteria bacterium]